jgi:hypothetical protein
MRSIRYGITASYLFLLPPLGPSLIGLSLPSIGNVNERQVLRNIFMYADTG